jgi:hypothetical protein
MPLKRENRYSRPLGVTIISTLFLIGGLLILIHFIDLLMDVIYFMTHLEEEIPDGGIGAAIAIILLFIGGFIEFVLSFLIILSGLGLWKMHYWGLVCSNCTIGVFLVGISIYASSVVMNIRSVGVPWESLTGITIAAILAGIAVASIVYLNRAYTP